MSMNKYTKPKKVFDLDIVKPGELIVVREFDSSGNCDIRKGIIIDVDETSLTYHVYNPTASRQITSINLQLKDLWVSGPSGIEFDIVKAE